MKIAAGSRPPATLRTIARGIGVPMQRALLPARRVADQRLLGVQADAVEEEQAEDRDLGRHRQDLRPDAAGRQEKGQRDEQRRQAHLLAEGVFAFVRGCKAVERVMEGVPQPPEAGFALERTFFVLHARLLGAGMGWGNHGTLDGRASITALGLAQA